MLSQQRCLSRPAFSYLYVSVREEQVHDDVLGQHLRVVDAQFDSGQLLSQLLSLVFLSGLSDVVEQRVFKGGAAKYVSHTVTLGSGNTRQNTKSGSVLTRK